MKSLALVIAVLATGCATQAVCKTRPCIPSHLLEGRIDYDSADDAIKFIQRWTQAGADAIVINIDSQGGRLLAGNRLAQIMQSSVVPIHCLVTGYAQSMAFYLLVVGCHERAALPRTFMMIHNPWLPGPSAEDAQQSHEEASPGLSSNMAENLSLRLKVSAAFVRWHLAGGSRWDMTPKEALEYGAIDKIFDSEEEHVAYVFRSKGRHGTRSVRTSFSNSSGPLANNQKPLW